MKSVNRILVFALFVAANSISDTIVIESSRTQISERRQFSIVVLSPLNRNQ